MTLSLPIASSSSLRKRCGSAAYASASAAARRNAELPVTSSPPTCFSGVATGLTGLGEAVFFAGRVRLDAALRFFIELPSTCVRFRYAQVHRGSARRNPVGPGQHERRDDKGQVNDHLPHNHRPSDPFRLDEGLEQVN